jgi:hypothetical protein
MSVRMSCEGVTRECGVRSVEYGHVVKGVEGGEALEAGLRGKDLRSSPFIDISAELSLEPNSYSLSSSHSVFMNDGSVFAFPSAVLYLR